MEVIAEFMKCFRTWHKKMIFDEKKLLIFDYDGTIADTNSIHSKAFLKVLDGMQVNFDYLELAGLSTEDAFKNILQKNNTHYKESDIISLSKRKRQIAVELTQEHLSLLPGCLEFLHEAKKYFMLAIVSSGSYENISYGLKKFKIFNLFHPIICRDHVTFSKPNPEGFLKARSSFPEIKDSQILVLEDSEHGFDASRNANIEFIDIKQRDWFLLLQMLKSNHG